MSRRSELRQTKSATSDAQAVKHQNAVEPDGTSTKTKHSKPIISETTTLRPPKGQFIRLWLLHIFAR